MYRILRADLINLTSRHSLSPLDADPSRRLPRGPAPSCEEPWASARRRRRVRDGCQARPAGGRRWGCAQPCGGAHSGPTPHGKAQSAAPASRRLRFSVTLPPGRRGAQPPASLRGTMENGPTGQMRSSNPPPGCGGVAPGPAGLGRRARPHGKTQ